MSLHANFVLLANYNEWVNNNLIEVSSKLTSKELAQDRNLFFGSVFGTLNHILVADTIWLKRFANHSRQFTSLKELSSREYPTSLAEILYPEFSQFCSARKSMDRTIVAFVNETENADYDQVLEYANTKGVRFRKRFGHLVQHLFNHQTHHRGQITAAFSQMGQEYGSTDLLMKIPG